MDACLLEPRSALLRAKHQRFVAEYLVDLNGTRAAIRAGYSPRTANEQAARLLAKASIRDAVVVRQAAQLERTELTADRVLEEIARIASADLCGLIDQRGCVKPIDDISPELTRALASFVVVTSRRAGTVIYRIRLCDKTRALELLGKHLGLFTEHVKVGVDDDLLARLDAGRLRNAMREP